jgi:adenosylhomocysteine nucleosidase
VGAKIGIITVWNEAKPLLKYIHVEQKTTHMQASLYDGHLSGQAVILAVVGMGKVQAAAVSQHLIDIHNVQMLVCCGSAGAISPDLKIGDVVIASHVLPHDCGEITDKKFNYWGVFDASHADGLHYHHHLSVVPALLEKARQVSSATEWSKEPPAIHAGCLASGDELIASENKKQWLAESFDAIAVEMESAAVAHVALLNDVPWLAVRAISDLSDSSSDGDYSEVITHNESQPKERFRKRTAYLGKLIRQPGRLKNIWEITRGIRVAAENAAHVTAAIITALDVLPAGEEVD